MSSTPRFLERLPERRRFLGRLLAFAELVHHDRRLDALRQRLESRHRARLQVHERLVPRARRPVEQDHTGLAGDRRTRLSGGGPAPSRARSVRPRRTCSSAGVYARRGEWRPQAGSLRGRAGRAGAGVGSPTRPPASPATSAPASAAIGPSPCTARERPTLEPGVPARSNLRRRVSCRAWTCSLCEDSIWSTKGFAKWCADYPGLKDSSRRSGFPA